MGISILLPTLCCEIYALAVHHTTLFQTMFLFAGHFSDLTMGKTLSDVNLRLQVVLPKIQAVLVSGEFDEGHIISVFLLSALFHLGGNLNAAAVHLQGLSKMLARNRQKRLGNGEVTSRIPIISFIQRQCIRFSNQLPSFRHKPLEIQPTVGTDEWDTAWSSLVTNPMSVTALDWTFSLQDFQYAVLQAGHRASNMRKSLSYSAFPDETLIALEVYVIAERIKAFQPRLAIRARGETLCPRNPLPVDLEQFPGTEPVVGLTEPIFGYILLTTYQLLISLTLISHPGLGDTCPDRIQAATELCRLYAVLQADPPECFDLPLLSSLFSAGLAFSPISYPEGLAHFTLY